MALLPGAAHVDGATMRLLNPAIEAPGPGRGNSYSISRSLGAGIRRTSSGNRDDSVDREPGVRDLDRLSRSSDPGPSPLRSAMTALTVRKLLFIAGAAVALVAGTALPASAATPATFTLVAGALSISAPTASVPLGSQVASPVPTTITGSLGVVTVTDQRGGATSWTASVIATAFTPPAGPADPASSVSYGTGTITVSATVVATPVAASDLTGVSPVVTGASTGISTASWNPTISVVVPANFAPGIYSATITHSVA